MPRKIYYKVILLHNGERRSAFLGVCDSKYSLKYPAKAKVTADPMSMGIFVFTSKVHAAWWKMRSVMRIHPCRIIKVIGHGRPRKPKVIPSNSQRMIEKLFYEKSWDKKRDGIPAPEGTVTFKSITTLE